MGALEVNTCSGGQRNSSTVPQYQCCLIVAMRGDTHVQRDGLLPCEKYFYLLRNGRQHSEKAVEACVALFQLAKFLSIPSSYWQVLVSVLSCLIWYIPVYIFLFYLTRSPLIFQPILCSFFLQDSFWKWISHLIYICKWRLSFNWLQYETYWVYLHYLSCDFSMTHPELDFGISTKDSYKNWLMLLISENSWLDTRGPPYGIFNTSKNETNISYAYAI